MFRLRAQRSRSQIRLRNVGFSPRVRRFLLTASKSPAASRKCVIVWNVWKLDIARRADPPRAPSGSCEGRNGPAPGCCVQRSLEYLHGGGVVLERAFDTGRLTANAEGAIFRGRSSVRQRHGLLCASADSSRRPSLNAPGPRCARGRTSDFSGVCSRQLPLRPCRSMRSCLSVSRFKRPAVNVSIARFAFFGSCHQALRIRDATEPTAFNTPALSGLEAVVVANVLPFEGSTALTVIA